MKKCRKNGKTLSLFVRTAAVLGTSRQQKFMKFLVVVFRPKIMPASQKNKTKVHSQRPWGCGLYFGLFAISKA